MIVDDGRKLVRVSSQIGQAEESFHQGTVIDGVSGQPVAADVYIVETGEYREPHPSEQVLAGSQDFEITLLDELDGWLVVKASGYETWKLRLRYHIKTSRKLGGPIQLTPLPQPGQLM